MPTPPILCMDHWDIASGEAFGEVTRLSKMLKVYSYRNPESCTVTDENLFRFLTGGLSAAKNTLHHASDLLFSLQLGEGLLDAIHDVRNAIDILSDEMKASHIEWRQLPRQFLVRIIRQDNALVEKASQLNADCESLLSSILRQTKAGKRAGRYLIGRDFWDSVRAALRKLEGEVEELRILFREREALCNLHTLTLERSFRQIQKEIRGS